MDPERSCCPASASGQRRNLPYREPPGSSRRSHLHWSCLTSPLYVMKRWYDNFRPGFHDLPCLKSYNSLPIVQIREEMRWSLSLIFRKMSLPTYSSLYACTVPSIAALKWVHPGVSACLAGRLRASILSQEERAGSQWRG